MNPLYQQYKRTIDDFRKQFGIYGYMMQTGHMIKVRDFIRDSFLTLLHTEIEEMEKARHVESNLSMECDTCGSECCHVTDTINSQISIREEAIKLINNEK